MSVVLVLFPPGHCQVVVHPMPEGASGDKGVFQVGQSIFLEAVFMPL